MLDWYVNLFGFLLLRFSLGKQSESEIMEKRDEEMCDKYYDSIDNFPDKMDQFGVCLFIFLNAL